MSEALQLAKALGGAEDIAVKNEVLRNVMPEVVPDLGNPLILWLPLGAAASQKPSIFMNEAGREISDILNGAHITIRKNIITAIELEKKIESTRELLIKCLRASGGDESKCRELSDRLSGLMSEYAELDGYVRRVFGVGISLMSGKEIIMATIDQASRVGVKDRLTMLTIASSDLPYKLIGAAPLPVTPTQPPPNQQPQQQQQQQQQRGLSLLSLFRQGQGRQG